jgi:hypothetical protein
MIVSAVILSWLVDKPVPLNRCPSPSSTPSRKSCSLVRRHGRAWIRL